MTGTRRTSPLQMSRFVVPVQLMLFSAVLIAQTPAPRPATNVRIISNATAFSGSDSFSAALDPTNWVVLNREGDTSNSEKQCYKSANTSVSGGFLNLLTKPESVTCNGHAY